VKGPIASAFSGRDREGRSGGQVPVPAVRPQLQPRSLHRRSGAIDAQWLPLGTVFAIKLTRERMTPPLGTPMCSAGSSVHGRSLPTRKSGCRPAVPPATERSIDTINERGAVKQWLGS